MEEEKGWKRVGNVETVIYKSEFVTENEEHLLLHHIYNDAPPSKWKSLLHRRLQNWGGVVHEKGLIPQDLPNWLTKITQRIAQETGLFPSPINHVLLNEYLANQGIMPHQDGPAYFPVVAILSLSSPIVMDFTPHSRLQTASDGKTMENEVLNSVSDHHPFSVLLMPRSLLIFKDNAYSDYLHGISDCEVQPCDKVINETEALMHHEANTPLESDKGVQVLRSEHVKVIHRTSTRISLTCRLVSKVHKNLFRF